MALLTPMNLAEARGLSLAYGFEIVAVQPVARGINSNFICRLADGTQVFIRVCEQRRHAEVDGERQLLEQLAGAGVPTVRPLRPRSGHAVGEHRGKPFLVFPYCPGQSVCQAAVTARHTERLGRALAQLHRAGDELSSAPWSAADRTALRPAVEALFRSELSAELHADLALLAERLADLDRRGELSAPATTIIHGDLFRDNVLWDGTKLSVLLDFELAGRGSPVFDLMVTVLAWCFGDAMERPLACALLAGYQSLRPLTPSELASCFDQARCAALRFAVSRVTDYELRPRELIAYKDYRRFLARLGAVEQIGRARFVEWLTGA